jgi:hypothetical protein
MYAIFAEAISALLNSLIAILPYGNALHFSVYKKSNALFNSNLYAKGTNMLKVLNIHSLILFAVLSS